MAQAIRRYTCELTRPITMQNCNDLMATGDERGHQFVITLLRDGAPVTDCTTCTGYLIRPDGSTTVMCVGTIAGNVATVALPEAAYKEEGYCNFVIRVSNASEKLVVFYSKLYIIKSQTDQIVTEEHVLSLDEMLVMIERMERESSEAITGANAAATKANTAAANADTATGKANTATANANAATTNANAAKDAANAATERANTAAKRAEDAASETLTLATKESHGVVKIGENLTITEDGVLSAQNSYVLPAATEETLGGIKVGENLTITEDGVLSAQNSYVLPAATEETLGGIKVGANLSITEGGVLSADVSEERMEDIEGELRTKVVDSTEAYEKTVPSNVLPYATLDKVGAKTLVWNQLANNNNYGGTKIIHGLTFKPNSNGSIDVTGVKDDVSQNTRYHVSQMQMVEGHTYLVSLDGKDDTGIAGYQVSAGSNSATVHVGEAKLFVSGKITSYLNNIVISSTHAGTEINITVTPQLFDLTAMFGAERAETMTAEKFRAMFPADYYPYSEPTLMSYEPKEVVSSTGQTTDLSALVQKYFPNGMHSAGAVYDEIDLERGVAVQRVGSVDTTGLAYSVLAAPIETPIDPEDLDGLTALNVEAGGSITFTNQHGEDYRVPLPNQETFTVKRNLVTMEECEAAFAPKSHVNDTTKHITASERTNWNATPVMISDAYSASKTYSVGDYCISGNSLWKCKVACTGVTPSEGTYWTKTLVAEFDSKFVYEISNTFTGHKPANTTIGARYAYVDVPISKSGYTPIVSTIYSSTYTDATLYNASVFTDYTARVYLYAANTLEANYSFSVLTMYMKK